MLQEPILRCDQLQVSFPKDNNKIIGGYGDMGEMAIEKEIILNDLSMGARGTSFPQFFPWRHLCKMQKR